MRQAQHVAVDPFHRSLILLLYWGSKNKASSSSAARVLLLAAGPPHGLRSLLVFFTFVTCVWLVCAYACVVCTIVNTHTNRPMSCCVYFSHYLVSFEQDFHLVPTLFLYRSPCPLFIASQRLASVLFSVYAKDKSFFLGNLLFLKFLSILCQLQWNWEKYAYRLPDVVVVCRICCFVFVVVVMPHRVGST